MFERSCLRFLLACLWCLGEPNYLRGPPQDEANAADRSGRSNEHRRQFHRELCEGDSWAATRQSDFVKSEQPQKVGGLTPEQLARMEREMQTVQQDPKMSNPVWRRRLAPRNCLGQLSKLLNNKDDVRRYLTQHHPEILSEFVAIVSANSLDQTANAV